jgi:hypothetical protein
MDEIPKPSRSDVLKLIFLIGAKMATKKKSAKRKTASSKKSRATRKRTAKKSAKRKSMGFFGKIKRTAKKVVKGAAAGAARGAVEGATEAGSKATGIGQAEKPASESKNPTSRKK